ncbi:MAG TPA: HAMP domain-containing sensor histidine kinase [Dongiaceae bacterium]|jgi:signal transduction histidine kinase|nr:HAMP domain-containing sensor histidine kinase [Dongiaceae bacterium]
MLHTWPLSKRFAILSGPVLVGAGVLIGAVNHAWFLESIENAAERNNVALARVLSNVVWPKFEADVLAHGNDGAWHADLNREIASLLRHTSVVKIKLYRADGSVAYSTDPTATETDEEGDGAESDEVGEHAETGEHESEGEESEGEEGEGEEGEGGGLNDGFETAIAGEVKSEIEFEDEINIFNSVITDRHTVSSYIPIFDADDHKKTVAVFEIYDDITALLSQFRQGEIRTGVFLGSVLLLIYASLVMMVMRSESVAKRHHEQGLRLADAAARADAASTAKSEFLANMSHELRTPLNAIVGFSEVMKDGLLGPVTPRPYAEYVRHIWVAASHLTDIIGNILDLSKIDAGKVTVEKSRVALPETILLVCGMMQDKAGKRRITLHQEIDPGLDTIVTDSVKLRQILLNLLSNAIKFTGDGGQVTLRASHIGDQVEFSIRDTGIGMDEAEIKIAMSPFGQIESPFSRMHEGTGLGLPLTLRLVGLIGGRLEISSQKGVGTLVKVSLPADAAAAPSPGPLPDLLPAKVRVQAE